MRHLMPVLVGLLMAQASFAQPAPAVRTDATAEAAVPARRQPPLPHLLVQPRIDGEPAGWWMLDTGARGMRIAADKAAALGLTDAGAVRAMSVGGESERRAWRGARFALGQVEVADLTYTELPPLQGIDIEGIVGTGFLEHVVLALDPEGETAQVHSPDSPALSTLDWQPLERDERGLLILPVTIEDGIAGRFRLDLGTGSGLALHQGFVEKHGLREGREGSERELRGGGPRPVKGFDTTLGTAAAAGLVRRDVPAVFVLESLGPMETLADGTVGIRFFEGQWLWIDLARGRIAVETR